MIVEVFIILLAGAALGFLIGLTGVGGGVLTVPVLILVIGLDPIEAVGTASLYAVLTKAYATYKHYSQGTVNPRAGIRFLTAALPGVICTSLLVKWCKGSLSAQGVESLQTAISYVIMGSIAFSLVILLSDFNKLNSAFFDSRRGRALSVLCTFLVGAIMGATSIGGGILIIPALVLFHRERTRYVGTSIFIAVLLMVAMSAVYAFVGQDGKFGDVDLRVAGIMAAGSLAGTHYGSALSKQLAPQRLRYIVVGVIVLAAVMMCMDLAVGH